MIIYAIYNNVTSKSYIGKTVRTLGHRWSAHKHNASHGSSQYIHRSMRKHGLDKFTVFVLVDGIDSEDQLNECEVKMIALFKTNDPKYGYNQTVGGEGATGYKHGPMRDEHRRKIAAALRGRPLSEERRRKISNAHRGKTLSPEARAKISALHKGRKRIFSDEHRQRISASRKGRPLSDEHKASIAAAGRGRRHSEATREKMRLVQRRLAREQRLQEAA